MSEPGDGSEGGRVTELPEASEEWLLRWARESIRVHLAGGTAEDPTELPPGTEINGGCFVSLHTQVSCLRGCIGTFQTDTPVWLNVRDMAAAASTRDPRFSPMKRAELDGCVIEISILGPRRAAKPADVVVGKHGMSVEKGIRRGVLLPQVATQNGWDAITFLNHTCGKAGLPHDAWRDGSVRIEVFSAQVFSEH